MGGCTRRSPGPLTMCCSDEVLWTTYQGLHLLDKKGSYAITVCLPFHTIVPPRLITNSRTWDKTPHWACGSFTSCLADSRFWGWVDTPLPLASLTPEKKTQGCVLSPLLYSIHIWLCCLFRLQRQHLVCWQHSCGGPDHRWQCVREVEDSQEINLLLNVSKNKELIVDFRRKQGRNYTPLISTSLTERVNSFK